MTDEDVEVRDGFWGSTLSKLTIGLALLVAGFLAGYIPSSLHTDRLETENRRLEQRLMVTQLLGYVGMASYEVERNNYASAAEYSTEFFNRVRKEAGAIRDDALRPVLEMILARRDEITAGLTAANPAVKEKVAGMYADLFTAAMEP